jgi:hypothetical protein
LNERYQRSFTFDDLGAEVWRRVYAFRQRSSKVPENFLEPGEAQVLIAQDAGFGSWAALTRALATGTSPVPPYLIDTTENRIGPRRLLSGSEWDELIGVMKERRITQFARQGWCPMRCWPDRRARTRDRAGSRRLASADRRRPASPGANAAAGILNPSGGKLTDRGLEVLRHLPNLRTFEMTWQRGITDAGAANLRFCDRLEHVDLMGNPDRRRRDRSAPGKPTLRYFSSGRLVTDRGLPRLHDFPMLKTWSTGGSDVRPGSDVIANATHLLIDGPFTDDGLASLTGLEGVFELDLFWHVTGITANGFAHLVDLPNLGSLGADGELSNNVAMRHIAAMPRLRRLRAQGTVATDDGFESLSRSRTIEYIWGRECPNLTGRGFIALSKMAALRGLGVSCKLVDSEALQEADLPGSHDRERGRHPRHEGSGQHERLERLTCMYCRDTTDVATAHVAALPLKYYYAGLTQITDRSLEILGGMPSLEQIELYECNGVSDAGRVLASLPRLREVHLDSLPQVTLEGTQVRPRAFAKHSTTPGSQTGANDPAERQGPAKPDATPATRLVTG